MQWFESWPGMYLTLTTYYDYILLPKPSISNLKNGWRADDQHLLTHLLSGSAQYPKAGGARLFFNSLDHFFFFGEISCILEKKYVFSNRNPCDLTSQRPPPLIKD
jgi:hypothetical protein